MLSTMKLPANRGDRNNDDIALVLAARNVKSLDGTQEVYEVHHAQDVISPSARARIQHWLNQPPDLKPSVAFQRECDRKAEG